MIFEKLALEGAYLITPEFKKDDRGFFSRLTDYSEFAEYGLCSDFVQSNIAHNHYKGILRGLHFQKQPHAEDKLIRCTRGSIYDVIVDLRKESPTYLQWVGYELSADNYRMLYVPKGFAHGYLTLTDHAEIHYLVTEVYTPGSEGGLRFDDPSIGIVWPNKIKIISEKDRSWQYIGECKN
ncbi:MAG: rfbC [Bacillales bacterium]|jgi:dTDP-4-dehydrorhamnose 3,5-epimerase|nr:rfbC [Bacillales bacterium]